MPSLDLALANFPEAPMACSKTHHSSPRLLLAVAVLLLAIQQEHGSNALSSNTSSTNHVRVRCHQQQAAALLQLKRSFSFVPSSCSEHSAWTALPSWKAGTDCCHWEGIGCDRVSGRVTTLNLSRQVIQINGFHPALFNLTSLKYLNLEENEFCGSHLPASGFERLTQLQVLRLSGCDLSGPIPHSLSTLHSLKTIDLSENYLTGPVPDMFSNFPLLETLVLDGNSFEHGTVPLGITQLKSLKVLSLCEMNFSGFIPKSIGNLSSLTVLCLDWNNFIGGLPWSLNNLTYLTMLSCDNSGLSGQVPSFTGLTRLEYIRLSNNKLRGPIPLCQEGNIYPNLTQVNLSNNSLSGTVPATIFTQPALQILSLQMNNFSGPIGEFHNPSATLTEIDLSSNQLSGAVPTSFSQLTALNTLALDSNKFTGTLDLNPYLRLRNLVTLTASYNSLLSATSEDLGSNASGISGSISSLELKSCNLTRVPSALKYLPKLDYLDLSYNRIGGRIPDWIWRSMNTLFLSHNKFTTVGRIPDNTNIKFLDLSFNKIRGAVPFPFVGYTLDYSNNKFSSIPPSSFLRQFKITYSINLANNKLKRPLPYAECHCHDPLQILDLSGNNLSGSIPPYLLKGCNDLEVLNLRGNSLSGTWPDDIDMSCSLKLVDLHGNQLEGPLPRSLVNCKDLQDLDVGRNSFVDSFPTWLGNLSDFRLLILRSNKFYGPLSIPVGKNHSTTSYFSSIQIIDLAANNFTGVIPSELFHSFKYMVQSSNHTVWDGWSDNTLHVVAGRSSYQVAVEVEMKQQYIKTPEVFNNLVAIDLSNNRFSGPVPKTVGNLTALVVLNMSHNALTCVVPAELGRLSRVESLDLSWNHLTGEIPRELVALTSLEWLNLSYNDLSGSIPSGSQFSTFPSSSFQGGNQGLYGCPLPVRCNLTQRSSRTKVLPPPPMQVLDQASADYKFELIVLWLAVGSGYGVGFALAVVLLVIWTGRRKKMAREN